MTSQETKTTEESSLGPNSQKVVRKTQVQGPSDGTETTQGEYQTKKALFRTYQIVWYILGVVEVILAFRMVLKFFGANTQNGFTDFIYSISNPFALPFAGILGVTGIEKMTFEWSTLIAMAVYAIVAYGIVGLFQLVKPTSKSEVENSVDNQ